MPESETKTRPSASGHRFGPDLACAECGITWEAHQKQPVQCSTAATSRERDSKSGPDVPEHGPLRGDGQDAVEKG